MKLHFGVDDKPYRSNGKRERAITTTEVADILEAKYHIMSTFYRVHQQDIVGAMENSLSGALESLMMGHRTDPWGPAMTEIQREFKDFILSKEVENVGIFGVPTKAALRGVNHRLKHPYAKRNPRRPSFRDTGTYVNSFRAWVET